MPLSSQQVRAKIDSVVQRITHEDIESPDARARFIASLPDWLYGTVGGNTACVQITSASGTQVIMDAGSGIRGISCSPPPKDKTYHIMFSHFHWDHLQGLPFFNYAYNKSLRLVFYSISPNLRTILENQMLSPYFPIPLPQSFTPDIEYRTFEPGVPFSVGGMTVVTKKMRHPDDSFAYKFSENQKTFIFATDSELSQTDFDRNDGGNAEFFDCTDAIAIDSQYTAREAVEKENWGHSSFCYAVDFAASWNIKKLFLFHHDPTHDDKKLYSILKTARMYSRYVSRKNVEVYLSQEGMSFELSAKKTLLLGDSG